MKSSFRYILGVVFLVISASFLAVALWRLAGDATSEEIVILEPGLGNSVSTPSQHTLMQAASATQSAYPKMEVPGAAQMLRNSREYRIVYENLTREGTTEARFYAQDIIRRCLVVRRLGVPDVEIVSSQQEAARGLLQARCSSFSDDELSLVTLRQLASDPRFSIGLAELNKEWSEAGGDETRQKEVFGKILQANDALLLQYVGVSLLSQYRDWVQLGGVEFKGSPALDTMRLAWIAAVCEGTATDCGPGDAYAVEICASMNICESQRTPALRALVVHDIGQEQLGNFDAAHAMFVKAIQSRDVQLFFPQARQ